MEGWGEDDEIDVVDVGRGTVISEEVKEEEKGGCSALYVCKEEVSEVVE